MPLVGLLNINKRPGLTSRRVVDQVARLVRPAKAGHAGTLDPLATGVLIVCIGQATRLIEYVQQMPKRYRATFLLGRSSPTEDIEGDVTMLANPTQPSLAEVQLAAGRFIGQIEQRPPAFSALKVAGRRAYALARAGQSVELQARKITIHELHVVRYEYPELEIDIACSSGTYVRSLGRDLAESLGTAAVMSALARTAIGPFVVEHAVSTDVLTPANLETHLIDPLLALSNMPRRVLADDELARLWQGRTIAGHGEVAEQEYAGLDCEGKLRALLIRNADGTIRAVRNLTS